MTSRSTIKSAKFNGEPVFINKNGELESYIPPEIITNRDAYGASLNLVFKHTADFHIMMLEIIAEKQGVNVEDLISTVYKDPRFHSMNSVPDVASMGYFKEEDLAKKVPVVSSSTTNDIDELTNQISNLTIATPLQAQPKKKKIVIKRKPADT